MKRAALVLALAGALAGPVTGADPVTAGDPETSLQQFADWMRENQEELRRYRWTERFRVVADGRPGDPRLFWTRYDRDGNLRRTEIGLEVDAPRGEDVTPELLARRIDGDAAGEGGPARGDETVARLIDLIDEYARLAPGWAQAILSRAVAVEDEDALPGRLHFRVEDVTGDGDRLDVWLDDDSFHPLRLVVTTLLEAVETTLTLEYTELPDGPVYPGRATVELVSPGSTVTVRTESFDFARRDS